MEDIEHHVQEEEGEMFVLVEEQFDTDVLEEIGARLEEEKRSFQKAGKASA